MTSIIDDFSPIYHAIVDDIINLKKQSCNTDKDLDYDCNDIYNITRDDISIRLSESNYSNENINNYKRNIKLICQNFVSDKLTENDNDDDKQLIITEELSYYNNIVNNYNTGVSLLRATQYILITYIVITYFTNFVANTYEKKSDNQQNSDNEKKNQYKFLKEVGNKAVRFKTIYNNEKHLKNFKDNILNGISICATIWIIFEYLVLQLENNKKSNNDKKDALNELLRNDSAIGRLLENIKFISSEDINNIKPDKLSSIIEYYNNINKLSLTNNKFSKNEKIKNINKFFNHIKGIILKTDNKFNDVIVDNNNKVLCLMKLIINDKVTDNDNKCNNDGLYCDLELNCGLHNLYNKQYSIYNTSLGVNSDNFESQKFINGLNNITTEEITEFYNYIKNNILDSSIKYRIKNSEVYKIVSNIFIIHIKYYNITKQDFIKYIYNYFNNYKNDNKISKLELINNYKSLINMIFEDYNIWKNINNKNNYLVSNIVNKHRFIEIFNKHTGDDIKKLVDELDFSIEHIKEYKNIYKTDIINSINYEVKNNDFLYSVFIITFTISISQAIGYFITNNSLLKNNSDKNSGNDKFNLPIILSKISLIFVLIFLNTLIYSYWFKNSIDINFQKSTILDSNNKFLDVLYEMRKDLDAVSKIKNLDSNLDNIGELDLIFNKFNIKYYKKDGKYLFSKFNSTDNYTILGIEDVNNLIVEDLYITTSNVIKIHQCCSFLKQEEFKVTLPYHEIITNIIYILITVVVISYLLSDPSINPFDLFNKYLKNNKNNTKNSNTKNQQGGQISNSNNNNNDKFLIGIDKGPEYILYIISIYLSINLTKKLLDSNVEYEKSLYS